MNDSPALKLPSRSTSVILAFAGIYIIWGTTYLAIALSISTLPPFSSGALRFLSAAGLMYAWLRLRQPHSFAAIDWRYASLCGVLLTGIGNGMVVWAQQGVPSGIAALVVASIPICVLALEWLFFDKRTPSVPALFGMTLAVAGVFVIVTHAHALTGNAQPLHIAAILFAVLAWSIGTLLQKRVVRSGQVLAFTCVQIFFGGLFQLLMAGVNREWRAFDAASVSLTSLLAVGYLIVFGSVVALNCYLWLLTKIPAQKVATYALVNPAVALLLGAWVLGESITPVVIGSVLLVLTGVSLVLFQDRAAALFRRCMPAKTATDID